MADYTATALLASIKRRGMIPATTEALSDDDLLEFANDELFTYLVPLIMSVQEEYFVATEDTDVVAGTAEYDIPDRALGGKVKSVQLPDGSGGYYDIPRIEPERADDYALSGGPTGFYLRGSQIHLTPTPSSTSTLRVSYFRRPSRLVQTTDVAQYASGTSTITTAATVPATFTSGTAIDFVSARPTNFDVLEADAVINTASGTSVTLSSGSTPSNIAANDYLCLAGESPIPQIPPELHPLLAQRVVVRACEALGLQQKQASAEATSERMRLNALTLISPRTEGAARVIVNRNAPGFARNNRTGFRWRGV